MSGFIKKIWKDRVTEFPTRRSLTKQDGSVDLVTVAREEGTVSQEGDAFSAKNMNDLEERVKTAFDAVDSSLSDKVSGFTSDTYEAVTGLAYDPTNKKLGLKVGADTVIPFSNKVYIKTFKNTCSLSSNNWSHSYLYLDTKDKTKLTIGSFSTGTATELHILGTVDDWANSSWILNQNSSFSTPQEFDVSEYDEIFLDLGNWVSGNAMIVNDIVLE